MTHTACFAAGRQARPRALPALGRAALLAAWTACTVGSHAHADEPGALATELAVGNAPDLPWRASSIYSHSALSGGRPDWDQLALRLQRTVDPSLFVAGFVDTQRRPPDTNVGYGGDFSWYPVKSLEWRGALMFVPDASFLPRQTYGTGLEWRAAPRYSVAGDYKRQNYSEGPIDQWSPAFTLWFDDDRTWFTARYVYGRAYEQQNFHSFSLRLAAGMPDDGRLTFVYARGADPEKDPGIPGVLLTNATNYAAFYRLKVSRRFNLIVGAEYEQRPGYYNKTTGSVGFDGSF